MTSLNTLKDSDIFASPEYKIPHSFEDRQTVKVIIKNNEGDIALITNLIHGLFLLPGGGAESDDLEKEAIRESLEETNLKVKIIGKVAMLEEFRNRDAKHYITTCFAAEVVGVGNEDLRTDEEKEKGLEVRWFSKGDALDIFKKQESMVRDGKVSFYNTAFNIVRDSYFLSL